MLKMGIFGEAVGRSAQDMDGLGEVKRSVGSRVGDGGVRTGLRNAMTVDVEEHFQVSAFERHVSRDDWCRLPSRVEKNVDRILELFSDSGVKATFFVLGWVGERHPSMVRRIVDAGHELGSHGWDHVRIGCLSPSSFREDVSRTKLVLEDLGGVPVIGYRAPSFSINSTTAWALPTLEDVGYQYSSSIVPIRHDLYGMPGAPRFSFVPTSCRRLQEVPVTTAQLFGLNLPSGGGGWFRLFPYWYTRSVFASINRKRSRSGIFYFHPWEIDPDQPVPKGLPAKSRFRHCVNLRRTYGKLLRLLSDFSWDRMDKLFLGDNRRHGASARTG